MLRVFHREGAGRPIRVLWTLEELGEPYELTMMTRDEAGAAAHRARHPLGRVPVLQLDDGYVFESAAICLHLADSHLEAGLIGPLGSRARALTYQWSIFAPAELEPSIIQALRLAEANPELAEQARVRFFEAANAVAEGLGGASYLVDGRFGVADVLVGSALAFTRRAKFAEPLPDPLEDYLTRLFERPAYQRARERSSAAPASA